VKRLSFLYNIPVIGTAVKLFKMGEYMVELSRISHMNSEEIKDLQSKYLKKIVRHAYNNVELYRRKWNEAGVSPENIKVVDDLHKLPIITKDDLRKFSPEGIIAKNYDPKDCHMIATSGSTGSPVRIFVERKRLLYGMAMMWLRNRLTGLKLGKTMSILVIQEDAGEQVFLNEIPWIVRRLYNMQTYDARDEPKNHIQALNNVKPDSLSTYPSVLRNMALFALREKVQVHQPKLIISGGELLDGHTKKTIERVFHGEIINSYGTTEAGFIAQECLRHEGLHIAWNVIVELVEDGKPVPHGSPGQVVVTDLNRFATPIIRYSGLGDIAVMKEGEGSCRFKSSLLELIEGRMVDSVILQDGKIIHPYTLTLLMQDIPSVAKFQIVQEKMNEIRILIVKERLIGASFDKESKIENEIIRRFKEVLGNGVNVQVQNVYDIPRPYGSHSHATVISLVKRMVTF